MGLKKDFFGELIGIFVIVFFGCGSVAVTILFSLNLGLFQIAIIWGIAVTIAIYLSRHFSGAHLNPAVSLAILILKRMNLKKFSIYIIAQFIGAFLAAFVLYLLFYDSISHYESIHGIIRGSSESIKTAMMFGEFYPNPGIQKELITVTTWNAFVAEGLGTFLLVIIIFLLTDKNIKSKPNQNIVPIFIGLTVSLIICIIAPLTQAGINPARDFAPRLFSMIAGWGDRAYPDKHYGFITVYILGPLTGGALASILFSVILKLIKSSAVDSN